MASSIWRLATVALVTASTLTFIDPAQAAPTQTNTTLTINKGGNRTGPQAVSGLAGATFDFYEGTQAGPPPAAGSPGAVRSCTTAASGQCSVDLPGRTGGTGGGTLGYWIVERTAPAGYSIPTTLAIGGVPTTPTVYNGIFTGNVSNNVAYTFPQADTGSGNLQARGNIMADIRDNPALPGDCGLNIALLMDVSGSITPFLGTVKTAANGFVDALTGTPSMIALYSFATNAAANLGPTAVSDAAGATTVKNAINALSSGGGTNWDAGLFQIAAAPTTFDAVVFLTDGNPTFYGPPPVGGPGNVTRFREIENGIFSANALKALGTKVVAVGVGDGISGAPDNLKAVSGPIAGTDYVQTGYDELAAVFREIALRTCAGTVSVVKKVIPPAGTIADATPAGGWTFGTATPDVTPSSGQTAAGSGALSFTADLDGASSLPVTITETQQTGYTLVQDGGRNATCTSDGNPVTSVNVGTLGFTVDALRNAIVTCTVYNRAPFPPAEVVVKKKWKINGTDYNQGSQPAEFQASLVLDGNAAAEWGQTYGGYVEGDSVTIAETIDMTELPVGCANAESGDLGEHTLAAGLNTFEVLNTVTCETRLKLLKEIVNPYGPPQAALTEWTLKAIPPDGGAPILNGPTGVNGVVTAGVTYSLAETTVPGYAQEIDDDATITPPATGTWHCVLKLRDGSTSTEFDGLNGTVTVQIGRRAECTAKNEPIKPKLTLKKSVTNAHGGTAVPADWILVAEPATKDTGGSTISGRDGEPSVINAQAIPHLLYSLSENSGPANYEQVGVPECVETGTTTPVATPGGQLRLEFGQDVTCTFVNQDKAPSPPPTPTPQPDLPATGTAVSGMLQTGGLLIVAGLGLLGLARFRRA
ncbi:VWA domain-containing protein [Catelliglobosispora koreensis]|uniref:VWA domain-containing protein n=1 Tax=Catelliglobosispora koreensis TaxID=129052 RepID=UPI0003623650|nr:VWA domain-containing protein [Catelliglobosispora koreensis]